MFGLLRGIQTRRHRRSGNSTRSGHAVVEGALVAPWIFFLFVGVLDFGFYAYSLISVQNAARVGALAAAKGSDTFVCQYVMDELRLMPNFSEMKAPCTAAPLKVTVTPFKDSSGSDAKRVSVAYETIQMIPIPGLLTGKLAFTRVVEMRVF